jgi:hypothetical protein
MKTLSGKTKGKIARYSFTLEISQQLRTETIKRGPYVAALELLIFFFRAILPLW